MNIVSSDCASLGADYMRQHSFRWFSHTFVWTRRMVGYYDFFVIADGRLWPVLTSCDVAGGALECMAACRNGVFRSEHRVYGKH